MIFEITNNQQKTIKKVVIFYKGSFGGQLDKQEVLNSIAKYNQIEVHLYKTSNQFILAGRGSYKSHLVITHKKSVLREYKYIHDYVKKYKIDLCLFLGSGYPWSSEFITSLRNVSYCACYFADDPEGAEETSKYYVKDYDYAFCGGIYYDSHTTISQKYITWGAKKSKFIPIGFNINKYRKLSKPQQKRQYDLIYVGSCFLSKTFRIFRLKRHFGNRMLFFGKGWNESDNYLKTVILKLIKKMYGIGHIESIKSNKKLVQYYQNSKIGINFHLSYGPSNVRNYEIPANGCLLITDCTKGTKKIYKVGKEVITYRNVKDAINKIEYYLKHEDERVRISSAGRNKAIREYSTAKSFYKIFSEINAAKLLNENRKKT